MLADKVDGDPSRAREAIGRGLLLMPDLSATLEGAPIDAERMVAAAQAYPFRDSVAFWDLGGHLGRCARPGRPAGRGRAHPRRRRGAARPVRRVVAAGHGDRRGGGVPVRQHAAAAGDDRRPAQLLGVGAGPLGHLRLPEAAPRPDGAGQPGGAVLGVGAGDGAAVGGRVDLGPRRPPGVGLPAGPARAGPHLRLPGAGGRVSRPRLPRRRRADPRRRAGPRPADRDGAAERGDRPLPGDPGQRLRPDPGLQRRLPRPADAAQRRAP